MYPSLRCQRTILFHLILCLCLATVASSLAENNDAELAEVRHKIERLRQQIEKTQTLHDSVRTELREIERDIGKLHVALKKLDRKLSKKNRALGELHSERSDLKSQIATHQRLLGRQIQAANMIGQQEYLKLILNQEDPSAVGRTIVYYDYFNRARVTEIDSVRITLEKLSKVEKQITLETDALNKLKQEQLSKQKDLLKVSREHATVVARLRDELVSKEQELSRLVENEKRLQNLVKQLDEAMPDILTMPGKRVSFAKLRGKLDWPTQGKVEPLFGKKRKIGKLKWNGVIIQAKEGRDIKAISHGRVAYADWLRGYGLLLILDHGDGYMSLYGHNQSIYKETGEWVEAGEIIASVGKSGGQEQAGVYFEIRHNGQPSDPLKWCKRG